MGGFPAEGSFYLAGQVPTKYHKYTCEIGLGLCGPFRMNPYGRDLRGPPRYETDTPNVAQDNTIGKKGAVRVVS